jgi:hypothetical protein
MLFPFRQVRDAPIRANSSCRAGRVSVRSSRVVAGNSRAPSSRRIARVSEGEALAETEGDLTRAVLEYAESFKRWITRKLRCSRSRLVLG